MDDERLAQRVGLWALAVLVLVVGFYVFVYGRIDWGARTRVHVYFHEVGALHEDAPFVVAGRTVGKVESIALATHAAPLGGSDGVEVTVALDAREAARLDPSGDIFQASKGPLADRYLELGPGSGAPGGLHEGQVLVGRDPPSLDKVLARTWSQLQEVSAFLDEVHPDFAALVAQVARVRAQLDPASPDALPNAAQLGPLIADARAAAAASDELRAALGSAAGVAPAGEVADRAGAVIAQARTALQAIDRGADQLGASLADLRTRIDGSGQGVAAEIQVVIDRIHADATKLDGMLATVDAIRQSYARGEGSLWKLGNDSEFANEAKELGRMLIRHPWRVLAHPLRDR